MTHHEHHPDSHTPDPAFVSQLETQLRSLTRRQALRDVAPAPRRIPPRLMWLFAVVCLGSLTLGATGALMMTAPSRGSQELRELRAKTALRMAEAGLQSVLREHDRLQSLTDRGAVSPAELDDVELRLIDAQEQMDLRASEEHEVRARRAPFNDSIAADIPGRRDYVEQRLRIRLDATARRVGIHDRRASRMRALVEAGSAPPAQLEAVELVLFRAAKQLHLYESLLALRREVVAGDTPPMLAEVLAQRLERRVMLEEALREANHAASVMERLRGLHEAGRVSPGDLHEAEHTARLALIRTEALEAELAVLEEMRSSLDPDDEANRDD